ncbi:RibD family protein [Laspinema sp. D1]|uniref:RibD family protein n=1 Tax=Laspinema palackyanum TaxID=3231601 RepID=UPI0034731474|nr:RibD family protein [Laspinema sp. D2b]
MSDRPVTTVVLAMSADGKISDSLRSPLLFGSPADKNHLEQQVAAADAVITGAGTFRVKDKAMRVVDPNRINQREEAGKPPQPVQIVASASGNLPPHLPLFQQPVPRWLVTTPSGAEPWRNHSGFDKILVSETPSGGVDWHNAFQQIATLGIKKLAILGGGNLVASLLAEDLIDELWLTICPLLIGGTNAPTPLDGSGFTTQTAPRLELLEVKTIEAEVFLHYRLRRPKNSTSPSS